MSTTPQIQYSGPPIHDDVPPSVRRHLQLIYQKLGNHTQAFQLLTDKVASPSSSTTTVVSIAGVAGGGTGSTGFPQDAVLLGNGAAPFLTAPPAVTNYVLTDNGPNSAPSFQLPAYSEPLTDGNSNFIFAAGDIIVVTGIR